METVEKINDLIIQKTRAPNGARVSDLVKTTGFSRAYIHRFFKQLEDDGRIVKLGRANQTRYVATDKTIVRRGKKQLLTFSRQLVNKSLKEDNVLDDIKRETGILDGLAGNISDILDYAFTEMLNNAIEHSRSRNIKVVVRRKAQRVSFEIIDWGVGIFQNIKRKKHLNNIMEAIGELSKGKQTTAPAFHSGEGIFFTSRVASVLTIQSLGKKLMFNNILEDIFITDIKKTKGTKVICTVTLNSKNSLEKIFKKYSQQDYEFDTTDAMVNLFKIGGSGGYVSRSQARRILAGLEKFKKIVFDFRKVKSVGQGFADEVFRVWAAYHPDKKLEYRHANENIIFMIRRAQK